MPTFKFKIISVTETGKNAYAEAFLAAGKINMPIGLSGLLPLNPDEPKPALQSMVDMELPEGFKVGLLYREIVDAEGTVVAESGRNYFVVEQK